MPTCGAAYSLFFQTFWKATETRQLILFTFSNFLLHIPSTSRSALFPVVVAVYPRIPTVSCLRCISNGAPVFFFKLSRRYWLRHDDNAASRQRYSKILLLLSLYWFLNKNVKSIFRHISVRPASCTS